MTSVAKRILQKLSTALDTSENLTQSEREKFVGAVEAAKDKEPPPTIVIIGESGVGKTSTINALFNAGEPVSAVAAMTHQAVGMYIGSKELVQVDEETVKSGTGHLLRVFDMPGLGDDMRTYDSYKQLYLKILPQADVIVWVHPAYDRMVQFVQVAVNDLFQNHLPYLTSRLVFGLNKADTIEPNDWNNPANVPSQRQLEHLQHRERDFTEKIRAALPAWRGEARVYSAVRRYQLASLFKIMLYGVPAERRWVLEERMSIANFMDLVDRGILEAERERMNVAPPIRQAVDAEPIRTKDGLSQLAARDFQIDPRQVELLTALPEAQYLELVRDRAKLVKFLRTRGGGNA